MTPDYLEFVPSLNRLLPRDVLDTVARALAFIRRLRTIKAHALVCALVLSRFEVGAPGFAAARRTYNQLTGQSLQPRPFQMRLLSESFVRLAERAFGAAVASWRSPRPVNHPLARHFADVVLVDSTMVKLSDALAGRFKGVRNVKAQLKVLLAMSAFGSLPLFAKLHAGACSDSKIFPPLDLFRARTLWLFDRGFLAFERFRRLIAAKHFFVCPLKSNSNAVVVAIHEGPRWARKMLKSRSKVMLRDLVPEGKAIGRTWDFDVLLTSHKKNQCKPVAVRLVMRPGKLHEQHGYFTNLPRGLWVPTTIAELYRVRWQIELVFKELKQNLNLETIPSKNANAVQAFVWASLIALALSRVVTSRLVRLQRVVGLASPVKPQIVTRSLRMHARVLVRVFRGALLGTRTAALVALLLDAVLHDARCTSAREDSFARIDRALGGAT